MKTINFDDCLSDGKKIHGKPPLTADEINHLLDAVQHNSLSDDDLLLLGKIRFSDLDNPDFPEALKEAALSAFQNEFNNAFHSLNEAVASAMPTDQFKTIALQMSSIQNEADKVLRFLDEDMKLLDAFIDEASKRTGCTRNEIVALLKPFTINYDGEQVPFWEISAKRLHEYLEDACSYITTNAGYNPFKETHLKSYYSKVIDALVSLNTTSLARNYLPDPEEFCYSYRGKKIVSFRGIHKELGTQTKKLLDISIAFLTIDTYSKSNDNTVRIPVDQYLSAQGYDVFPDITLSGDALAKDKKQKRERIKYLKKEISKSCDAITDIKFNMEDKGDSFYVNIFNCAGVKGNFIYITFNDYMANLLRNNKLLTAYPVCLLRLDNRKPNAYSIADKIRNHSSQYNNRGKGTDRTLGVKTLLESAPEIPEYNETKERGDWRHRIIDPLENALNDLVDIEYITKWEYRRVNDVISQETARALDYHSYERLVVDYVLKNDPTDVTKL